MSDVFCAATIAGEIKDCLRIRVHGPENEKTVEKMVLTMQQSKLCRLGCPTN